jgi:hypothetical protein
LTREAVAAPMLREIRRGETADALELIDAAGNVTILHAHGVHDDERARVRELALKLLQSAAHGPGRP